MPQQFEIFFSNRLEILYQNLKTTLFGSQAPMRRRLVVVDGPAMKTWLMLHMAQDPDIQVAMGMEILYLNQAFEHFFHLFNHRFCHLRNQLEIALAIEKEITSILHRFPHLSERDQHDWLPLIHYLKLDPSLLSQSLKLSRKMERRLIGLSQHVARLFQNYGRYGKRLMAAWENGNYGEAGWQARLWQALFNDKTGWTYPYREFQQPIHAISNCEIHFFSISFVNHGEFEFISRLAQSVPVYYYLLSPCAVFWSDIRSDRESAYLQAYWQQRLGYSSPQVLKLEELLRDRNPILANFGRLGREMAYQIEESGANVHACYALPSHVQEIDNELFLNEDLHFIHTNDSLTLLHAIQADILLMRNPQHSMLSIQHDDLSIQLHIASTRQREVEILYHNLIRLIEKHGSEICPSDIIVISPELSDYIPYIQSVFGSKESLLDFQILDLSMHVQSEFVQAFLQLLALGESRWDVIHLLQLFEHTSFRRRHQLTQSDYDLIQDWIEKSGIRWGENNIHRDELLQRYHCQQGMTDQTDIGTWDYGLTRLLLGLTNVAQSQTNQQEASENLPYDKVDFSQGEILEKWILLLHSLRDDLAPLCDRTQMTMEDWMNYFACLLEAYFQPDVLDSQSVEDYENLKIQFETLKASALCFKEAIFPFHSVKTHLMELLQQREMTYREGHLQTVRFCSMVPLRAIPAKIIALIGMQEGAFPRSHYPSSLNLLNDRQDIDYCPSPSDYDRYLFLESIHSAQDYLLISYQGYQQQDGKEARPALMVEELLSYLDKHYSIQGQRISDYCIYHHPFDAFNEIYFKKDSRTSSYSFKDYKAAQAYYRVKKDPPHCFVHSFDISELSKPVVASQDVVIDLKHLTSAARNPIKFHLNQALEIYLQTDEDRQIKNEECFSVSSLDKYMLKQLALKEPIDSLLWRAEKEGKLPFGLFKSVACKRLKDECSDMHDRLQRYQVSPKDLFQIEFCTSCSEPTQMEENHWLFPVVRIAYPEGCQVQVIGKLSHVTPKGLLSLSKGTLSDIWKIWPQFLAYQYAVQHHPDRLQRQLIPLYAAQPKKAFFEDPEPYMKQFIDYYQLCLNHFSPMLPDWIPLILEGDTKGLKEKMRSVFSDPFTEHQHHDLKWILHKDYLPDSEEIITHWKKRAQTLLKDLIQNWYKNKSPVEEV